MSTSNISNLCKAQQHSEQLLVAPKFEVDVLIQEYVWPWHALAGKDTSPIDCARVLFPISDDSISARASSSASNSYSRNENVDSDSTQSNFSSTASSRSSSPDISVSYSAEAARIFKLWKGFGPGSEQRMTLPNGEEFSLGEQIGQGNYKRVFFAASEDNAVAVIYAKAGSKENAEITANEIKALLLCEQENIPGILPLLDSPKKIGKNWERYVTAYCDGGTLNSWAQGKSLLQKLEIAIQVAVTLEQMHKREFAHNDIKSENIGILNNRSVLLDFGLFTQNGTAKSKGLTLAYLPPRHHVSSSGIQADVFSLGATIFELVQQELHCGALCHAIMRQKEWHEPTAYVWNATQEDIDRAIHELTGVSEDIQKLLDSMLKVDPTQRISAKQARETLELILQK